MKLTSIFSLALIVAISIFTTSCCACRVGSPKVGELESGKWRLIELNGKAVSAEQSVVLTFNAAEKMIYGDAPCNNFFAGYSTAKGDTNNIEIKGAGVTRKLCPDSEVEDSFVRQITDVVTIKSEGNNLLLLNKDGNLIAIASKE